MARKIEVYKLITPFGSSLHETDEVDGKIYVPPSVFRRCVIWSALQCKVQLLRLANGKWDEIFHNRANKLHLRIIK